MSCVPLSKRFLSARNTSHILLEQDKKDEKVSENETFRTAYFKEVKRGNELADKHIGTLMLLVYEGCISDSRARELIGMSLEEWRFECGRVIGSPVLPLSRDE